MNHDSEIEVWSACSAILVCCMFTVLFAVLWL